MFGIRDFFETVLPDLKDREGEFRDFYFSSTVSMQLIISTFVIAANFAIIYMDFLFTQGNLKLFLYSITARVVFILFTAGVIIFAQRNKYFDQVENAAVLWVFGASLYFLLFNFLRPSDHLTTGVDIIFIFGVYVFFGYRLRRLFPIMFFFSSVSIWLAFSVKAGIPHIARTMTMAVHILVQMVGLLAAMQIRSFRRKAFLAYVKEREASELATRLWQIDPLTGCFARRHFLELAEQEIARAKRYKHPFCVVMMDLDRFKNINDQFGHMSGDQVLKTFSKLVHEQKRRSDILGRLGGEEFALLLPETSLKNAQLAAERIQNVWAETEILLAGLVINSTVSVGVAELGNSDQNFEELLHNADMLMYEKKSEHHEQLN